ncbi:MAG: hypothetical protein HFJ52_04220 [Clostridia bacterium]|nr:hypothetical protein [Clostridia bacterium]
MQNFIMNKKYILIHIFLAIITYGIWLIIFIYLKIKYSKNNALTNDTIAWILNVSGVTFKNEDGSHRQKLISNLHYNQELCLEPYKYENKDAIFVKTLNNEILGNISSKNILDVSNKILQNKIIKVTVAEASSFLGEENEKIYYLKIKLLIKK